MVIPAYEEAAAVGVVVQSLRAAANWREVLVVDDGSARRDGACRRDSRCARHQASLQQGERRVCQDRHPPRVRRIHLDHRCRRPAHGVGCVAADSFSRRVRSRGRHSSGLDAAGVTRAPPRQQRVELGRGLSHRPRHSRPHVRSARGARQRSARISPSPPERILDAHDDDAVVREGRVQRAFRTHYRRSAAWASRRSSSSPTARGFS